MRLRHAVAPILFLLVGACTALPGGTVTDAATVVYTSGSSQYTAAVQLKVPAADVFEALLAVVAEHPDLEVINQNDKAYLIKVGHEGERYTTGQVTSLGPDSSLLYVWAEAGSSGRTGREMAFSAVDFVCEKLNVDYELVNY